MDRFLRNQRLRVKLWLQQEGKCAICRCDLNSIWHADHIIPFVISKRTDVNEMQALCPKCNQEKGSKIMIPNYEVVNYCKHCDITKAVMLTVGLLIA